MYVRMGKIWSYAPSVSEFYDRLVGARQNTSRFENSIDCIIRIMEFNKSTCYYPKQKQPGCKKVQD